MASQLRVGTLTPVSGSGKKFEGWITIAGRLDEKVALRPHPRARPGDANSNAPSYEVFLVRGGRELCCGSAWIKSGKVEFLSMTLDQVDWPYPLNLAAFPPDGTEDDAWVVVWSRPRGGRVQSTAGSART